MKIPARIDGDTARIFDGGLQPPLFSGEPNDRERNR